MHKYFAKTEYLGKSVAFLPECHSTNDMLNQMVKKERQEEGSVVITQNQTKGRGQRGNSWESAPGLNATFSILLRPEFIKVKDQYQIHLITSLAIYQAIFSIIGKGLRIKWPNDIYFGDKKLAGILIENMIKGDRIENCIIGIGININQEQFQEPKAVSILELTQQTFEVNEIIENVICQVEHYYSLLKDSELEEIRTLYERRLYRLGTISKFKANNVIFTGKITGIDESGLLKVLINGAEKTFKLKEIEYVLD